MEENYTVKIAGIQFDGEYWQDGSEVCIQSVFVDNGTNDILGLVTDTTLERIADAILHGGAFTYRKDIKSTRFQPAHHAKGGGMSTQQQTAILEGGTHIAVLDDENGLFLSIQEVNGNVVSSMGVALKQDEAIKIATYLLNAAAQGEKQ